MNLQNTVKQKVAKAFEMAGFENANTLVRTSDRPDISDYQSNGALALAKIARQNPRTLAETIAEYLRADSFFKTISVDGPDLLT